MQSNIIFSWTWIFAKVIIFILLSVKYYPWVVCTHRTVRRSEFQRSLEDPYHPKTADRSLCTHTLQASPVLWWIHCWLFEVGNAHWTDFSISSITPLLFLLNSSSSKSVRFQFRLKMYWISNPIFELSQRIHNQCLIVTWKKGLL